MTLSAMWIKKNMLHSPGPSYHNNYRAPTEAEIKVQRSLQKLSIPEWYLNNNARPPKILTNDTPIESRPPVWKEQPLNKSIASSTTICPAITLTTINRNGLLETVIGAPDNQPYGFYKLNQSLPTEGSPVAKKTIPSSQMDHVPEKKSSRPRLLNISRTFPRVSPSRKIQNINMVFPQARKVSLSHRITDNGNEDSQIATTKDSLDESASGEITEKYSPESTGLGNAPGLLTDSSETKICPMPNDTITDIGSEDSQVDMTRDSLEESAFPKMTEEDSLVSPGLGNAPSLLTNSSEIKICSMPNDTITEIGSEDSQVDMTKDSLEESASQKMTEEDSLESPGLENAPSLLTGSSETRISRMPNQQLTYIKPWKSPEICLTPEGKFSNRESSELTLASSTPQKSGVPLPLSDSLVEPARLKQTKTAAASLVEAAPEAPKVTKKAPMVPARAVKPMIRKAEEMCDACKAALCIRNLFPVRYRPLNVFRQSRTLEPINEMGPNTWGQRSAADSPTAAFFTSKRKSTQLEHIVRRKNLQRGGKSLVQEIIEELNEKCRISAPPTYVTPGSKNFVKKLVRALERGVIPRKVQQQPEIPSKQWYDCPKVEEEEEEEDEDEKEESSEPGSEDDVNSAAISTSISYKDTDSSDSDLRSPTLNRTYNYDWNMNIERDINNESVTPNSETELLDEDEDSVYWIPVTKSNLPRSSSIVSVTSKLSLNTSGRQSPCVSPIKLNSEGKKGRTNSWGKTYKSGDYGTKILRPIEETTILDSGYSDKSRRHSSESSDDTTWLDDAGQTASESGSSSFSLGTFRRRSSTRRFSARPFVL